MSSSPVIVVSVADRKEKSARLRRVLARYKGGRFETDGGGGAGGMMFFRNREGALFYIGGFNPGDADQIATALNLVLELLDSGAQSGEHLANSKRWEKPR